MVKEVVLVMLGNRYRLDRVVGRGGTGEVWAAWDLRLARPVAVKLVSARASQEAVARFRHEARTEAHLHHRHIVEIYDFGTQDGRSYLVMELVEGPTLADVVKGREPRPASWVAGIGAQIADGLAEAHRRGVVHRDIKPSNILLDGGANVKIADFGIAQSAGQETTTRITCAGTVTGTSAYMSPEAARGQPLTAAADVYSLGCTLYQVLAGRPPFVGEHPLAVLCQQVECDAPPLREFRPGLPQEVEAFVLRMLAKDPRARPTALEVRDWCAAAARQSAAPAVPASPVTVHAPGVRPGPGPGDRGAAPVTVPAPVRAHRKGPVAAGATAAVAVISAAVMALAWPASDGHTAPPQSGSHPTSHATSDAHHRATPNPGSHPSSRTSAPGEEPLPVSDRQPSPPGAPSTTGLVDTSVTAPRRTPGGSEPAAPAPSSTPDARDPSPTTAPPTPTTPPSSATTEPGPTATTTPPTSTDTLG
ncbi:serine/threonine-protein kinase [Streptomyces sp. NRRL F-5123]|uniref:serine/threonine-protein kinase n=1 Tax=Streptomyces sp. NRRL F-5123 TaxID=1463856 RepID=UPI00099CF73C|nr:serine/threonine-protein kinase [Streptomyces sp. NRRL F-5123]